MVSFMRKMKKHLWNTPIHLESRSVFSFFTSTHTHTLSLPYLTVRFILTISADIFLSAASLLALGFSRRPVHPIKLTLCPVYD
jgi:hypothetical protein